jgi:bifunctional oligoribonuclease and PAP phosphatase NrnA
MNHEIPNIIKNEDKFVLATHVNPDGDALGSLLGLYNALLEMNKQCWAILEKPIPDLYTFLPGSQGLIVDTANVPSDISWIIALDCAEQNRLAGHISQFSNARIMNIDHHPTNPLFGQLNHVVPSAMSTAELVYQLLRDIDYKLSRNVGICLYAGLYTDTGGFRFSGVTSHTLQIGSELLAPGIDSYEVTRPLYEEYPLARLKIENMVLQRIEAHLNDQLLMSTLFESDLISFNASMSDTENLVNRLREIKDVKVGVLITKMPDITRVSFRSKNCDVSKVAQALGGGGHKYAAGLKTNLELSELKSKIVELVKNELAAVN